MLSQIWQNALKGGDSMANTHKVPDLERVIARLDELANLDVKSFDIQDVQRELADLLTGVVSGRNVLNQQETLLREWKEVLERTQESYQALKDELARLSTELREKVGELELSEHERRLFTTLFITAVTRWMNKVLMDERTLFMEVLQGMGFEVCEQDNTLANQALCEGLTRAVHMRKLLKVKGKDDKGKSNGSV